MYNIHSKEEEEETEEEGMSDDILNFHNKNLLYWTARLDRANEAYYS